MSSDDVRALALELADVADRMTMAAFRGGLEVRTKLDGSVVTATDEGVEAALRSRILAEFPDHRVLGEEGGTSGSDADAPTWIIDPIDGTTNFVKGNPVFATLIAYSVGPTDLIGVASAPALGSRWVGVIGVGTEQDGRPVTVSDITRLADAEVAVGAFSDLERGHPGLLASLATSTVRQRGYGDFWSYCLLAGGSTDVVLEGQLNRWDLAAVRAIVEAAGGRVTDVTGRDGSQHGSAVATNGLLHDEVLRLLAGHRAG